MQMTMTHQAAKATERATQATQAKQPKQADRQQPQLTVTSPFTTPQKVKRDSKPKKPKKAGKQIEGQGLLTDMFKQMRDRKARANRPAAKKNIVITLMEPDSNDED